MNPGAVARRPLHRLLPVADPLGQISLRSASGEQQVGEAAAYRRK